MFLISFLLPNLPTLSKKELQNTLVCVSIKRGTCGRHRSREIEGKKQGIGRYENEEEAAADFARAVFKYRGPEALAHARARVQNSSSLVIDLSGVPPRPPILKSTGRIKTGASKFAGVYFNKAMNKWYAQIHINGKDRHIGYYKNEEEAAIDYARAVFKFRG